MHALIPATSLMLFARGADDRYEGERCPGAPEPLHYTGISPIIAFLRDHDNRQQSNFSPQSVQRYDVTHGISTADAAL
jgi:hypothetical protein